MCTTSVDSWRQFLCGKPLDDALKLLEDIVWGEFHVEHRSVYIRVPHELHQSRQGNPGTSHVGAEGMAKSVRIGLRYAGADSVVAKERTKTRGCHGLAACFSFEADENILCWSLWSFDLEEAPER